jgi:hypothetical protein
MKFNVRMLAKGIQKDQFFDFMEYTRFLKIGVVDMGNPHSNV